MNNLECPRCLGKKHVDQNDIKRLNREDYWIPGTCAYCDGKGVVDKEKIENIPVDKIDLTSDLVDDESEAYKEFFDFAINQMVNGKGKEDTKKELVEQGLDEMVALLIVTTVDKKIKEVKHDAAKKDILYGALWAIGGISITAATYAAASDGGRYVAFYGAIIYGGYRFLKGLFSLL